MYYYICITDKGGKSGTCPDMAYHLPKQHLIRTKKKLTNVEVQNLLAGIANTRRSPKIIGSWVDKVLGDDSDFPVVLDYDKLNISS